ncbi:glycosyltransferase [Alkalicoccus chagannorensis]|uniref:glycosyltransferase n=1 Tax=Alkalicoccus chagannorensis TaxID=427072 RepID=UPI000404E5D0|nr:glycosyltransferase [Alkalicoccus chagannorensis]
MFWFTLILLGAASVIALQWFIGARKLPFPAETASSLHHTPRVSIIAAARNEEKEIGAAVQSMLDLRYPDMEVLIINDRSTDGTMQELQKIKQFHRERSRLKIIDISHLPDGWLGKNHALFQGAREASGEWLLFTDADIHFRPQTLQKVIPFVHTNEVDHLALVPENQGGTRSYRAFHSFWSIIGLWNFIQLRHAGIGAFNLMRREAYLASGTHEKVKAAPDDDLKLGKAIASAGFQQQLGIGNDLISVQWYENIPQVITGLEKNLFAFMRYRVSLVLLFAVVLLCLHAAPFVLFPFYLPALLLVLLYAAMYWYNQRFVPGSFVHFFTMPVMSLLFIYCLLRSTFLTLKRGGVVWRGTLYPLKELRRKS